MKPKKRPWYLVLALILCTSFGACGWFDGYQGVLFYRDTQVDTPNFVEQLPETAAKARAREASVALFQERDAARRVGFPLAVGTFVIGAAVLLFTARAFANRGTSKKLLLQFLLVQLAIIVGSHFALAKVATRQDHLSLAIQQAHMLGQAKTDLERQQVDETYVTMRRIFPPLKTTFLAFRAGLTLFVIVALTRRRTREFYGELDGATDVDPREVDPPNTK